eukprot:354397-Rhodomonas_salina.2
MVREPEAEAESEVTEWRRSGAEMGVPALAAPSPRARERAHKRATQRSAEPQSERERGGEREKREGMRGEGSHPTILQRAHALFATPPHLPPPPNPQARTGAWYGEVRREVREGGE